MENPLEKRIIDAFNSDFTTAVKQEPVHAKDTSVGAENAIRAKARVLHRMHEVSQVIAHGSTPEKNEFPGLTTAIIKSLDNLTPEEIMTIITTTRNVIGKRYSIIYKSK